MWAALASALLELQSVFPPAPGSQGKARPPQKGYWWGEILLFPLANHQAAWRWDIGKEGKDRGKGRLSI